MLPGTGRNPQEQPAKYCAPRRLPRGTPSAAQEDLVKRSAHRKYMSYVNARLPAESGGLLILVDKGTNRKGSIYILLIMAIFCDFVTTWTSAFSMGNEGNGAPGRRKFERDIRGFRGLGAAFKAPEY